jgi:hypothetical protein
VGHQSPQFRLPRPEQERGGFWAALLLALIVSLRPSLNGELRRVSPSGVQPVLNWPGRGRPKAAPLWQPYAALARTLAIVARLQPVAS